MEHQESLGPDDYARWALLGDPHARVPTTLKELVGRIGLAIRQACSAEKKKQVIPAPASEKCPECGGTEVYQMAQNTCFECGNQKL